MGPGCGGASIPPGRRPQGSVPGRCRSSIVNSIAGIIRMGEAKRRKTERAGTPAPAALQYPGDDWNAASTPSVVAEKSCGSCTKCCTVMGVPELKKRPWDECPHVLAGRGCN